MLQVAHNHVVVNEKQGSTVIGGVRYAVTVHAHAYTATVTTAATCTTPGVRTHACACGESYTEEIPATGHSYVRTEENGNYVYTCSACGDSYTETVPALGHNYAAADDAGDTIYTCMRCGEQHSELLPREYVSVKTGKTTEAYTLDGEQSFTHTGDAAIARGERTVVQGTVPKLGRLLKAQRLGLRLRLYGRRLQLRRLQTYRRRHLHLLLVHQQPDVRHVCPCRPRRGGPL